MEGFGKKREEIGRAEIGALVIAAFSALDAGPAQALEIQPSTSWNKGVVENVRESAIKEKVEHVATYVQFADGSSEWLKSSAHEAASGTVDILDLEAQARSKGKKVSKMCVIHTHPAENYRGPQYKPQVPAERIPMSPSPGDIIAARRATSILGNSPIVRAAADGNGVWYYSGEKGPVDEKKFLSSAQSILGRAFYKDFDLNAELPKLQQAYRDYLHGEVRFVPYEKIKDESPCAGVQAPAGSVREESVPIVKKSKEVIIDLKPNIKTFKAP
jgi:hypothetical protein